MSSTGALNWQNKCLPPDGNPSPPLLKNQSWQGASCAGHCCSHFASQPSWGNREISILCSSPAFYVKKFFQDLIPALNPPASDPFPTHAPLTPRLWTRKAWVQPIVTLDPTTLWWSGYWTFSCWIEQLPFHVPAFQPSSISTQAHNPQYEAQSSDPQDTKDSSALIQPLGISVSLLESLYMG